jgi:hypothetical protein
MRQLWPNVTSTRNAGCFKKGFTMLFKMLLCGECYENVYTSRRTNYPSLKVEVQRFPIIRHTVAFGIPL